MKILPTCMLALILATSSTSALAGTPINETRDVDADARIDISNVRGSVTVTAWDRNQVGIEGTLGSGNKGLERVACGNQGTKCGAIRLVQLGLGIERGRFNPRYPRSRRCRIEH